MYLKFTVYGHKQACTLQTHFRNAVPLVWGLLRLAPINTDCVHRRHLGHLEVPDYIEVMIPSLILVLVKTGAGGRPGNETR